MNAAVQNIRTYTYYGHHIKPAMMSEIDRYVREHQKPGPFINAVISNNLMAAVKTSDEELLRNLPAYIGYFENVAPAECWGSDHALVDWVEQSK